MSRHLPPHPNLEHLKKQAKELLHELQQQRDPAVKLADAQHAIAREYGFASWPKLKAHVEALPSDSRSSEKAHPFVGTWTANLSKSQQHPANPFQSATIQFAVVGDAITVTHTSVDASGQAERGENTVLADGQEHLSEYSNGYLARWLGPHILEVEARKDGQVVDRGRYEVSADGQTLTISGDEQVIVLERG
jgi:hypothetical protein